MYGIELEFDWLHFPFICFLLIFHVCTSWPHTRFWSCFERHDTVLYVLSAKFGFVHGRGSVNIYGWISLDSEKAMAAQSSTLAWKIPWAEEPGGLRSMGSLGVGHDWATSLFTCMPWRRKWQPTPVLLPGESQGRWSLVGCCLWDRTESDTTEATQQQQSRLLPPFFPD